MKISALKLVLQSFEDALRSSRLNEADELNVFQALLTGRKDGPVTRLITDLKKKLEPQGGVTSEPVKRLRSELQSLSNILLNAGAKTPANEINKLADTLTGDFRSISDLVEHVLKQDAGPPVQNAGGAVREELVQSYFEALRGSQADNAEFDRNISLLKADKRIRTEEMRDIAKQFLGFEIAKKKGRGPALQEIINHQAINARQVARSQSR